MILPAEPRTGRAPAMTGPEGASSRCLMGCPAPFRSGAGCRRGVLCGLSRQG